MANRMRMFAIVVASGTSERFGSNKLTEFIGNETVLERSVRIAKESCDGVVVVADPSTYDGPSVDFVVVGGNTRSQSVRNGLAAVPQDVEIIAVHDAARPCATRELYERGRTLIENGKVAAIPAVQVVDTIKQVNIDEQVHATIDRSSLRAVQTPQIFLASVLREAHDDDSVDTDDAALVERLGHSVVLFEGAESNRKITTTADLAFLRATHLGGPSSQSVQIPRIGSGYDIHPFGDDQKKKLVLGGVEIDYVGLEGHSDSDVVAHALTDALLSAIGAPDLGTLFPASDAKNKNMSSMLFLAKAVTVVHNEGLYLGNASIIINAQQPKLIDHIDDMKKTIQEAVSPILVPDTILSITPKHGEGIGDIGRGEAISVYATVMIIPRAN